ncbi:MAG: hypothetical protein B7Z07_01950 [Sphingomonadales bacterium 32-67-7]|nr:MAG: hypothetical protein B7Z07_01950 [Sphingomonadales bacterium 32-67-7]
MALGLFFPIVSLPVVGGVSLIGDFTNLPGLAMLMLAGLAAYLVAKDRLNEVIWPAGAFALMLAYRFIRLQLSIAEARALMEESLAGNPFADLARAAASGIQLQWGWLVLALGTGALIYISIRARKTEVLDRTTTHHDQKPVLVASLVLMLVMPAMELWAYAKAVDSATETAPGTAAVDAIVSEGIDGSGASATTREEQTYIRDHLQLYDLDAKYFDSMLDGRVPGVDFKIKNNGNKALNRITVIVEFKDASGASIAEEEYNPVLVSDFNYGGDNTPLKPNYIWQQEQGQFYTAKSVPSEWASGKVSARISDIEFAPEGDSR